MKNPSSSTSSQGIDIQDATIPGQLSQAGRDSLQVQVTGSNNLVIQQIIASIDRLPKTNEIDVKIRNFLFEYLGSPDEPTPFGGRATELSQLDAWLDANDSPPFLLLTAAAGRGKSALLAHWIQRLLPRKDIGVAFIPVSIRYGTNLSATVFAAWAAQLSRLHNEPIPSSVNTSTQVWRNMVADYLMRPAPAGSTLLVVLDGIDEAADWGAAPDLFPLPLPPGLRVVISARYTAECPTAASWLDRLGLSTVQRIATNIELGSLTQEGVADVLKQMRFPLGIPEERVDIVSELYRLSDLGDPLLIKLYVDDLMLSGDSISHLTVQDLTAIPSGLEGYFDRWWSEQRAYWGNDTPLYESGVYALQRVLACALGALLRNDIWHLVPDLNSFTLDAALNTMARFVIGDGKQQGFAFSHSRLGEYFYERLNPQERQVIESRLLAWGTETLADLNAERLAPDQASPYLLQHYSAHLQRAGANPEVFFALVSDGWQRAWYTLEGAYSGFLGDVEKVWDVLERYNRANAMAGRGGLLIAWEMLCALCYSSIHSLASTLSPLLIEALLARGIWTPTQALAYGRQIPDLGRCIEALIRLAGRFPESKGKDILKEVIIKLGRFLAADSAGVFRTTYYFGTERYPSVEWISRVAALGLAEECLPIIGEVGSKSQQIELLSSILEYLPESRKTQIAETALSEIALIEAMQARGEKVECFPSETGWQAVATAKIARHLTDPQRFQAVRKALSIARTVGPEISGKVASTLSDPQRQQVLLDALRDARGIAPVSARAAKLATLVPYLADPLRTEVVGESWALNLGVITAGSKYVDGHPTCDLIHKLASSLPTAAMDEALKVASAIGNEYWRATALAKLAPHLSEEQQLLESLDIARNMSGGLTRARLLSALMPLLPQRFRSAIQRESLAVMLEVGDEYGWVDVLRTIAPHLVVPWKDEVLAAVRSLTCDGAKAAALVSVMPRLLEDGFRDELLIAMRAIGDAYERSQVLMRLAIQLGEPSKPELFTEALTSAHSIEDEGSRWKAFLALAPHLPESLKKGMVFSGYEIVDRDLRLKTLASLAHSCQGETQDQVLKQVSAAAVSSQEALPEVAYLLAISGLPDQALEMVEHADYDHTRADIHRVAMIFMIPPHALHLIGGFWSFSPNGATTH